MHRKFMATIAAASIAITSFAAAPAKADPNEVGRTLAAVLGLAIVGAVIIDKKNDKKHVSHARPAPRYKTTPHRRVYGQRHHVQKHRHHNAKRLPRHNQAHRYGR
jgi:hypothetical protein